MDKIIKENYNIRGNRLLKDFYNDEDKMKDFLELNPDKFLKKYPNITEEEYNDTAYLYAKDDLEHKLLDTFITINENKNYNMLEENAIIHKTSEEYNKDNPYNVHFSKEELAKIESVADDKYKEMDREIREDNISSSFYNLLNFINNNENASTSNFLMLSLFNTKENGMIIEKDTKTNCIFFNEYDEQNAEDDGVMSTFGTKEDIEKYLLSLKKHSAEIVWSDGLTDMQNEDIIKNYEYQIEEILEDIKMPSNNPNKIYLIQETGNRHRT